MVRKNKKGWIRILEATIAILLVATTLVIVYTQQPDRGIDSGEYVYLLQKEILNDLSINKTLRNNIINMSNEVIPNIVNNHINNKVPDSFSVKLRVCDLEDPPQPCKLNSTHFSTQEEWETYLTSDTFVEDTIISSNITHYNPKKVRLFIWEN